MTRIIKFRAWDKITQRIYIVDSLDTIQVGLDIHKDTEEPLRPDEYRMLEQVELMQYTKLKDKNGLEIYEGDILFGPWSGRNNEVVKIDEAGLLRPFYELDADGEYEIYLNGNGEANCEVIGNIYENPELSTPEEQL